MEAEELRAGAEGARSAEQAAHAETQRKLKDAFALLEKARAAQREEVQRHAGALDEQVCVPGKRAWEAQLHQLQRMRQHASAYVCIRPGSCTSCQ